MPFLSTNSLLSGGVGNDLLTGTDWSDTLLGGAGNDTLRGGLSDDTLNGGSGTNQIDAGAGNDVIIVDGTAANGLMGVPGTGVDAGTGYDTLVLTGVAADYHVVTVIGSGGTSLQITDLTTGSRTIAVNVEQVQFADSQIPLTAPPAGMLVGSALADTITGRGGAETLYGFDGADSLSGAAGADHLDGGAGADLLAGGQGSDRLLYDPADLQTAGGTGRDTLQLGTGAVVDLSAADQVVADAGVTSGFENVDAAGAGFSVTLTGSPAANVLTGGSADDMLSGGRGADVMTGGAGADRFVFTTTSDSNAARDSIADFQTGSDLIDLTAVDAVRGGADDAFVFVGDAEFTAAGQLRYSTATGLLEADITGDGLADMTMTLATLPALTAADFML